MRLTSILAATFVSCAALATAAASENSTGSDGFFFSPMPRWNVKAGDDFDRNDTACPVMRRECPTFPVRNYAVNMAFDELYDASGKLVGLRITNGSGCRPLDEAFLIGHRNFRHTFSKPGQSDIDGMTIERADGADPGDVRIVKPKAFQVGGGCY